MYRKMQISRKKFFASLILLSTAFLLGGCTLGHIELNEETQARLDKDTEHAVADAKKYLKEKYHMEYELNTFEPVIYGLSSETTWNRTHYDGEWTGEFTIDGKLYEIEAFVSENVFRDNYQEEQIQSAYKELAMQYFPDVYEENGVMHEVEYEIKFWGIGFFSKYYDRSNLGELLQENGMLINISIDEDAEISDEFWLECEEAVAKLEADFEGSKFEIVERNLDIPHHDTAYGKWKSAQDLKDYIKD